MNRAEASGGSSVRSRLLFLLVAQMAVLAAAGCGSSSSGGAASSSASTTAATAAVPTSGGSAAVTGGSTVEINNFMFTPMTLTVSVGTTVTWKFDDSTPHTVAADDKSFISAPMSKGQSYTHTFA